MKVIKLWGGLGNQMFQYAFGKAVAKNDLNELFFYNFNTEEKQLDILSFNIKINFLKEEQIKDYLFFLKFKRLYRVLRKLCQLFPWLNKYILVEKGLKYNKEYLKTSDLCFFDGYWQSYKYFDGIKDEIINDFQLKEDFVLNQGVLSEILKVNSVSIHVRRGDYLNKKNSKIYTFCDKDYYLNAIQEISNKTKNPKFFIFSNDLFWVKNEFKIFNNLNVIFVDNSQFSNSSLQDFVLMRNCNHNIIANSSFSWWGAWLNSNEGKVVISPKEWFKDKETNTNAMLSLIPKEWQII